MLIGSNGSGKSTLVQDRLADSVNPDKGEVVLDVAPVFR